MKLNNKYLMAAGLVSLAMVVTSCKKDQDWSTDAAYNRAFSVKDNISVNQADTSAEITFNTNTAGTYTIELATDTLYDDIAEGIAAGSSVHKADYAANKEMHVTVSNLIGSTRYFLRIRCEAEGKASSYWTYYHDSKGYRSFKTKSEQIFNTVSSTDILEDGVRLTWDASKAVTSISVYKGDERKDTVILDNAAMTAGEYTFSKTFGESGEAIKSSTTYKFYIWLNQTKRGELNVQTAAAMPSGDYKYQLTAATTVIDNDLLQGYAATAAAEGKTNYSVTIGIPAGTTLDFHGTTDDGSPANINIPDGMAVTFFGMPGGDAPTLKFQKMINIEGAHSYIAFENVKVVDDGSGYFVNQSKPCSVGEFIVKDSEISGFGTSFFRFQGGDAKNIDKLTLTNSIFHDMCSGYSFLHIDANKGAGGGVKNLYMDKCTLYNIAPSGKMFLYSRDTDMESISVNNTTFYNCIGNGNYWVDFDKNGKGCTGTFEFVKCLFTKTPDEATNKNIRGQGTPVFDGCKKTNDFFKVFSGVDELDYSAADLFTAPATGDFKMLKDLNCGDPRWFKE